MAVSGHLERMNGRIGSAFAPSVRCSADSRNACWTGNRLRVDRRGYDVSVRYASTLRGLYAPYLVATGVWSLAHRRSFERVTGPKQDYWLVQTVGALAIAIGGSLGVAARRRAQQPETIVLGAASCVAFGLASVRASRTESRLYLGDALLEIGFLVAWLQPAFNRMLSVLRSNEAQSKLVGPLPA